MDSNYIYSPAPSAGFRCRVPLKATRQIFVVDGKIQDNDFNFMGVESGFSLELKEHEKISELIQVIFVREKGEEMQRYTTSFHLDADSSARILLCSHTLSDKQFSMEESIPVFIGENANLDMVVMQNEHNKSKHATKIDVDMRAGASFKMNIITLHGGDISNDITVNINGKKAECELNGLYLSDDNQKVSTKVDINHNSPECKSSQLFKGILNGKSATHFNGKILVAQDSQKTEAYQANNNLLVSKEAKAYTQPHLEIYADDVKCSHGATIGSLDPEELFYMRSRGISLYEAKLLQQQAFAHAVLSKISNEELKERLAELVEKRLRGEFSHCSDCSKHCC